MEAARLMKMASPMIPPSGRAPEQGSRWDRFGTEACGGDKIVSGLAPRVSEFMGIYRPRIRAIGATGGPQARVARPTPLGAPPALWGPCGSSGPPEASRVSYCPEKIVKKFHRVWTSVGMVFL